MPATEPRRSPEEIARLGAEVFDRQVRPAIRPEDDGQFVLYAAEVAWGGGWRPLLVSAVGDEVLLGMRLLVGHELRIAVVPGGVVEITPLKGDKSFLAYTRPELLGLVVLWEHLGENW